MEAFGLQMLGYILPLNQKMSLSFQLTIPFISQYGVPIDMLLPH
jgi:hypothetical protein